MPFQFLQNVMPASFVDTLFQWKNFMKSTPSGPGWSVFASSDGQPSTSSFSVDNVTSNGSGTGGLNNSLAWFILKPPSPATKQFCFQRSSANQNEWRVKYSFDGFDINTATYNKTPQPITSGDEAILYGSGTDAAPVFADLFAGLPDTKYIFNAAADNSSHAFYFFAYPISKLSENNATAKLMMIHDPLKSGSYASQDTDPSVTGIFNSAGSGNNITQLTMPSNYSSQFFWGSFEKTDGSGRIYDKFSIASYGRIDDSSNNFTMSNNQVLNPHTAKQELFPCMYFCKANYQGIPLNGFKGYSSFLFIGSGQLKNGHLITLDSDVRQRVFVNGFILPWNGSYLLA